MGTLLSELTSLTKVKSRCVPSSPLRSSGVYVCTPMWMGAGDNGVCLEQASGLTCLSKGQRDKKV